MWEAFVKLMLLDCLRKSTQGVFIFYFLNSEPGFYYWCFDLDWKVVTVVKLLCSFLVHFYIVAVIVIFNSVGMFTWLLQIERKRNHLPGDRLRKLRVAWFMPTTILTHCCCHLQAKIKPALLFGGIWEFGDGTWWMPRPGPHLDQALENVSHFRGAS